MNGGFMPDAPELVRFDDGTIVRVFDGPGEFLNWYSYADDEHYMLLTFQHPNHTTAGLELTPSQVLDLIRSCVVTLARHYIHRWTNRRQQKVAARA